MSVTKENNADSVTESVWKPELFIHSLLLRAELKSTDCCQSFPAQHKSIAVCMSWFIGDNDLFYVCISEEAREIYLPPSVLYLKVKHVLSDAAGRFPSLCSFNEISQFGSWCGEASLTPVTLSNSCPENLIYFKISKYDKCASQNPKAFFWVHFCVYCLTFI